MKFSFFAEIAEKFSSFAENYVFAPARPAAANVVYTIEIPYILTILGFGRSRDRGSRTIADRVGSRRIAEDRVDRVRSPRIA